MKNIFRLLTLSFFSLNLLSCSSPTKKILVPGMGTLHIRKNAGKEEIDRIVHDTYHTKLDWIAIP